MAEASQDKPDLTTVFPKTISTMARCLSVRSVKRRCYWPAAAGKSSRSAPPAPITAGRSARG
jgi:hypothetical protein